MFILETRYGDKGYAFWFKILELLGSTNGHSYQFDQNGSIEYLLAYTRTEKEQATEILDLLASLDAIDLELWTNNHIIWSDNFIDGIKDAYRNRTEDMPNKPVSDVRNPQRKVKESKGKETKENNGFDQFWDAYPLKRAKGGAERAFKKLNPDDDLLETILAAIKAQKNDRVNKTARNEFVPDWKHPASWLNQKCWEDEISPIGGGNRGANRNNLGRQPAPSEYESPEEYDKRMLSRR